MSVWKRNDKGPQDIQRKIWEKTFEVYNCLKFKLRKAFWYPLYENIAPLFAKEGKKRENVLLV